MTTGENNNDTTHVQEPLIALAPGTRLQEYQIKGTLGIGGFGITYLAEDCHLNKSVAIKEYFPTQFAYRNTALTVLPRTTIGSDPELYQWGLDRVIHEARVLAQFDHPNLIRVARYFEQNGTAYIVMDFASGEDLGSLIKRHGAMDEASFRPIFSQLLDGLEVVHQGDILHRDIKPVNIIIREDGNPVLIDFGAARQTLSNRATAATAFHSAGYTPIEQLGSAGKLGPWTDIYSLAATAYNAVVGRPPPDCNDRILNDNFQPAAEAAADRASQTFLRAIDWGLNLRQEDRPQSIVEWRAAFSAQENLSAGKHSAEKTAILSTRKGTRDTTRPKAKVPVDTPTVLRSDSMYTGTDKDPDTEKGKRKGLLMAMACMAVVCGGGAYMWLGNEKPSEQGIATPEANTIQVEQIKSPAPAETSISDNSPTDIPPTSTPLPNQASTNDTPIVNAAADAQAAGIQTPAQAQQDESDFQAASYIDTPDAYTLYLRLHPNGQYVEIAKKKRGALFN